MKWDEQLNRAIDYIEANLEDKIDLDTVAKISCQSKEGFQRTFSLIMNMSINEYIRKRRMTLAAIELRCSTIKIIDLAFKFGYESPEAFTRSFKELFGIPPSKVRNSNVKLTLFPRITCLLTLKGEIEMTNKIESMNGQPINWKGFDWAALSSPEKLITVYENCENTAKKWKEAGHRTVLDLGAGMGQNAMHFAKQGFRVSAIEISDYAVEYMKNWAKRENLRIDAVAGDMHSLPYNDNAFDCLFEYHTIRHTDSAGIRKIIAEIERVVKPGGEVYLTFLSKDSNEFTEKWWPEMDRNTLISQNPAEKDIPYFYADLNDFNELLVNFDIENIKHIGYFSKDSAVKQKHYYINARKK